MVHRKCHESVAGFAPHVIAQARNQIPPMQVPARN
jgi:hypothetical protein